MLKQNWITQSSWVMTNRERMKRKVDIIALLMLVMEVVASLCLPVFVSAQEGRTLTSMDFNIVGVTLSVGPEI